MLGSAVKREVWMDGCVGVVWFGWMVLVRSFFLDCCQIPRFAGGCDGTSSILVFLSSGSSWSVCFISWISRPVALCVLSCERWI